MSTSTSNTNSTACAFFCPAWSTKTKSGSSLAPMAINIMLAVCFYFSACAAFTFTLVGMSSPAAVSGPVVVPEVFALRLRVNGVITVPSQTATAGASADALDADVGEGALDALDTIDADVFVPDLGEDVDADGASPSGLPGPLLHRQKERLWAGVDTAAADDLGDAVETRLTRPPPSASPRHSPLHSPEQSLSLSPVENLDDTDDNGQPVRPRRASRELG